MRLPRFRLSLHVLVPAVALGAAATALPLVHAASDAAPREPAVVEDVPVRAAAVRAIEPAPAVTPTPSETPTPEPEPTPAVFASVDGVELVTPVLEPTLIGFHEANGAGPQHLDPVELETGEAPLVLPPRGRGTDPSSAVDIAIPEDVPVTAVVSGTVVDANAYALYGSTTDQLVTISPDGRPDLLVRVLHVDGLRVEAGQRVEAGETVLADSARLLPFGSQIDDVTGQRLPHVHLEVVRIA